MLNAFICNANVMNFSSYNRGRIYLPTMSKKKIAIEFGNTVENVQRCEKLFSITGESEKTIDSDRH